MFSMYRSDAIIVSTIASNVFDMLHRSTLALTILSNVFDISLRYYSSVDYRIECFRYIVAILQSSVECRIESWISFSSALFFALYRVFHMFCRFGMFKKILLF